MISVLCHILFNLAITNIAVVILRWMSAWLVPVDKQLCLSGGISHGGNNWIDSEADKARVLDLSWVVKWSVIQASSSFLHLAVNSPTSSPLHSSTEWPNQSTCAASLLQGVPGVPHVVWKPWSTQNHWFYISCKIFQEELVLKCLGSPICFDKSMSHINIVEWKLQWTRTVCTCSSGSKPDDVPMPHPVQLSHCLHCCCCNPEVKLPSLESVAPKYWELFNSSSCTLF